MRLSESVAKKQMMVQWIKNKYQKVYNPIKQKCDFYFFLKENEDNKRLPLLPFKFVRNTLRI